MFEVQPLVCLEAFVFLERIIWWISFRPWVTQISRKLLRYKAEVSARKQGIWKFMAARASTSCGGLVRTRLVLKITDLWPDRTTAYQIIEPGSNYEPSVRGIFGPYHLLGIFVKNAGVCKLKLLYSSLLTQLCWGYHFGFIVRWVCGKTDAILVPDGC